MLWFFWFLSNETHRDHRLGFFPFLNCQCLYGWGNVQIKSLQLVIVGAPPSTTSFWSVLPTEKKIKHMLSFFKVFLRSRWLSRRREKESSRWLFFQFSGGNTWKSWWWCVLPFFFSISLQLLLYFSAAFSKCSWAGFRDSFNWQKIQPSICKASVLVLTILLSSQQCFPQSEWLWRKVGNVVLTVIVWQYLNNLFCIYLSISLCMLMK